MSTTRPRVLTVDDEPNVLEGLRLVLGRRYDMATATSGAQALELVERSPSFAVVLSDMRMPAMNGAVFLARMRERSPSTVRMLLTGQSDVSSAADAVNEGQVFRFLTKPCPPMRLRQAVEDAVRQHELVTAESVLLEQTLASSVRALMGILEMVAPLAFGRATRIKALATDLARSYGTTRAWALEIAALLSQIGCVTLPGATVHKLYHGVELEGVERSMVARLPELAEALIADIPRLDDVRNILARLGAPPTSDPLTDETVLGAEALRIALDYDRLRARGLAPEVAIEGLQGQRNQHHPELLEFFARNVLGELAVDDVRELPLRRVRAGMIFAEDLRADNGALLVARGYEVTPSFVARAGHYRASLLDALVRVIVPHTRQSRETRVGVEREQLTGCAAASRCDAVDR